MISKIKRTLSFINLHPLAKKSKVTAYKEFIIWQIQSLNKNKFYIKKYIGDVKFYAKKRLTGITGNIYCGLHEFNDMGFLLHFLRPQDCFFDIGANVGSYTLLASGYVGASTVAFEPATSTFNILEKNINLNNLNSKVILQNKALGKNETTLKFSTSFDTINHIIANDEDDNQSINVEVSTLNNYLKFNPILLKIDVEGFEKEVIEGGKLVIENNNTKAIIIELNGSGERYGYKEKDIHNYLLQIGYFPYLYNPLERSLKIIETFGTENTIYIKDLDFVKSRCKDASFVKALGVNF